MYAHVRITVYCNSRHREIDLYNLRRARDLCVTHRETRRIPFYIFHVESTESLLLASSINTNYSRELKSPFSNVLSRDCI